jgi:VPDSG-CTERM motif
MRRLLFTCCIALGFGFVAVPKASADTITLNLNDIYCNCLPTGSTDGGTVTLTTNADGSVTFDVDLSNSLLYHDTNAFALFAFNYTGSDALTLDSISQSGWTLVLGTNQDPTGVKMDGAGQAYTYGIVCASCSNFTGVNEFTFTVSGDSTLTLAMFETTGSNNNDFAAAVYNSTTTSCTGVIGGGDGANQSTAQASTGTNGTDTCGGTSVPDGGTTVGLLGLGLLGLGYLRRRLA